ncbi:MAG: hypothetical protein RL264_222 [Bacteroidota bacterium]|jgi:transposase-like protein
MSKHRKSWSVDDKEKIILYYNENGLSKTVREYGVSAVSIYKWKEKFEKSGRDGLAAGAMTDLERELKNLQRENMSLKRIVAEKELAIQVKDALLKKSQFQKK